MRFARARHAIALALSVSAVACNDSNVKSASADKLVHAVYQSQNCGRHQGSAQITWIDNQADLGAAYRRVTSNTLGSEKTPPDVDFGTHGLVLIELGQRPTAGYRLRLASERVVMDKGDGLITVSVDKPVGATAQVITSPCLLVSMPRGNYVGVRALSTDTAVNVQTTIP